MVNDVYLRVLDSGHSEKFIPSRLGDAYQRLGLSAGASKRGSQICATKPPVRLPMGEVLERLDDNNCGHWAAKRKDVASCKQCGTPGHTARCTFAGPLSSGSGNCRFSSTTNSTAGSCWLIFVVKAVTYIRIPPAAGSRLAPGVIASMAILSGLAVLARMPELMWKGCGRTSSSPRPQPVQ